MASKIKYLFAILIVPVMLAGCEGPTGPRGLQGLQGPTLDIQVKTGTILNSNYTVANPSFASIPLASSGTEPTILFFGIENPNGVYAPSHEEHVGVIWGGTDSDYTVPGTKGWYAITPDQSKNLLNANYQVKFVQ